MDTNGKMDPNLIAGDASAPEHVVLTFFFLKEVLTICPLWVGACWCLICVKEGMVVVCSCLFHRAAKSSIFDAGKHGVSRTIYVEAGQRSIRSIISLYLTKI